MTEGSREGSGHGPEPEGAQRRAGGDGESNATGAEAGFGLGGDVPPGADAAPAAPPTSAPVARRGGEGEPADVAPSSGKEGSKGADEDERKNDQERPRN
ncbi:MAG: hypothetical protein HQL37_14260 [Alphaproteobacteria bacterium]|nr:hypothetical protein [Alphaproteobacteria bacterium]